MTVDPAVLAELAELRSRLPQLSASVVATADGMVVAHDAHGMEPDSLAALAAAHLALARRLAQAVHHGDLRESLVQCDAGYITSYAAGPDALLTLVTCGNADLAIVHLQARRCVRRLISLLAVEVPQTGTAIPNQAGPPAPLARRTPMATLPESIRPHQNPGRPG